MHSAHLLVAEQNLKLVPIIFVAYTFILMVFILTILYLYIKRPLFSITERIAKQQNLPSYGVLELDFISEQYNASFEEIKKFREIIESAFDMVILTDYDGIISYVNPAFEKITGYHSTEVIGKSLSIFFGEGSDSDLYRSILTTVKGQEVWKGEIITKKKDGSLIHTSSILFPVFLENNRLICAAILRDITQEKLLYEQLLRVQKLEAVGSLAGGIAHDFNNLLTSILGYADILLMRSQKGDFLYKPASIIKDAALKGASLAKEILSITRKEPLKAQPTDISKCIIDTLELIKRSTPSDIITTTHLTPNLPKVMADPNQLSQVIMNLALNAKDAMPDGGILTITTSLVEDGEGEGELLREKDIKGGSFIKITVSDTGTGIDNKIKSKIFDPFFTTKEPGKGTGLGLFMVNSIVTNHGGFLSVDSKVDKGTTFNIYLPVSETTTLSVSEEQKVEISPATILVIDDDQKIIELYKDLLEPLKHTVLTASSGEIGIKIYKENKEKIDLILLDMILVDMDGSDVFSILKDINEEAKIVISSGYTKEGMVDIKKLLNKGASDFLQKPFTQKELLKVMADALYQRPKN
ncbi:MAG: PAS domain S-box protein [Thermodesulfovibrionales bacterium]